MKPTLIALAALATFDAVATGGHHVDYLAHVCIHAWHYLIDLGWSMEFS